MAEDYYRAQGYDEFYAVQNKSGNGVDIVARNSQTGDMIKVEVKTTQQDKLWNNGEPKEIPLKGDQKTMGEKAIRMTDLIELPTQKMVTPMEKVLKMLKKH